MANGQIKESNLKVRVTILPKDRFINNPLLSWDQYRHVFGKGLVCLVERAH